MEIQTISPRWFTDELKQQVRKVFEPRYKRKLSDTEVLEVAQNLTTLMEISLRLRYKNYGEQIKTAV